MSKEGAMSQKKVLVTEKIADVALETLEAKGYQVDVKLDLSPQALAEAIADYDALIVRSATNVTADILDAAQNLKIIGRAGVTVDNIDIEAATERDIIVCNAPVSNIVTAAEHTFALLLACARNVCQANASMHAGQWERAPFTGVELYEKTLAIFGLGRIGGLVAERARAFGMNVVGHDPYCSPERAQALGVTLLEDVDEICAIADFISVHLPLTEDTHHMFGPQQFAQMKDGVIVVNTARPGIVDQKALADFLAAGKVRSCGIDVFEEEPCTMSPLHEFPNAILTPHIAAVTYEAQHRAGAQIAEYVWEGLEGSIVPTAINISPLPPDVVDLVGPYAPACQMMGRILTQINGEMPKVLKIEACGLLAQSDIRVLIAGLMDGLLSYRRVGSITPANAEAVAARHGIKLDVALQPDAEEYASSVRAMADGTEVAATVFGISQAPRIVSLMGYKIDMVPSKSSLLLRYEDAPGRIGVIGTLLGNADVNITTMQIGVSPDGSALVFVNVTGEVSDKLLRQLREAIPGLDLWRLAL